MKAKAQALKNKIIEHKKELFIVFLIFVLAFGTRAYLMKYELFFEFDGYWHARMISYIIQTGTYPDKDPLAYYQLGGSPTHVGSDFFWYLSAFLYKLFTLGAAYDKQTWILIVKILPALFGGLIAVVAYFIGKEAFDDKRAGILLGFFTGIMPAFIYRQMAGWLEDDSFGWLPGLIAVYFLTKAVKAKELKSKEFFANALLSGIFAGIMAWSWSGFQTVPLIFAVFAVLGLLAIGINKLLNKEKQTGSNAVKICAGTVLAVALMAVFAYPLVGLAWANPSVSAVARFFPGMGGSLTGGEQGLIGQSVGEESVGINFFGNKYNFLLVLLPFGIAALAWNGFLRRKYPSLLLLAIVIVTLIMAITKLKFTYYFGLGMAIAAAIALFSALQWLDKKEKRAKILLAGACGFFLLTGVAAGSFFVSQNIPNIEYDTGWKEALKWANINTPQDSKFFNWWDEGHWVTFIAERKATLDNRNYGDASPVASFIILSDENKALSILNQKEFSPDYLIFGDDLLQKQYSLANYAFQGQQLSIDESNWYSSSAGFVIPCSYSKTAVSGQVSYVCGSNVLSEQDWTSLPAEWQSQPNQVVGREVLFVYRSSDSKGNLKIYVLSVPTNGSMLAKLWFGKKELQPYFEQVYFFKDVKIFKVN
ncbi:MAG TPA: hypothetical protein HA227_02915 [Candidatus Diapherotrites archaeon]|uniref:dolichyl-phosphooligosaccharide-protein glycotransferase n=1 Tax=Candidatus Iainarchaeum sp. TaxID=3101447 RepID=A0A7J4KT23_9ARCH|nr:hypothetical protein [Candidatus Diapherotrites archaeon]